MDHTRILLLIRENLYKQVVQSFATPITQSTGTSPTEKGEHPHKAFLKKLPLPHTSSLPNSTDKCPNPVEWAFGKCVLETATSPVEKYFSCFNKAQASEMAQKGRLVLYDSFLSTKKSYARLIKCCILLKFFTAVNKRLSCLVLVIRAQCPPTFSLLPFSNISQTPGGDHRIPDVHSFGTTPQDTWARKFWKSIGNQLVCVNHRVCLQNKVSWSGSPSASEENYSPRSRAIVSPQLTGRTFAVVLRKHISAFCFCG